MYGSKQIYAWSGPTGQMWLDRVRHRIGALPRINPAARTSARPPFPEPYQAAVIISADLELAWAWRYVRDNPNPLQYALDKAGQSRRNFPKLIEMFDHYEIPITWAIVGHLFLEECSHEASGAHPDIMRLRHFTNEYWAYQDGDWFDADPCSDYGRAPAWYGPDLVAAILSARMKHEIACHSFSHIVFTDGVCPPAVADSELSKCQQIARQAGQQLTSVVFPANLSGNLASLKRCGFKAYRWHGRYELDVPRRDGHGLWQIPGGLCWEKRAAWPTRAWLDVLRLCLDRALQTGTVLHLWFHPSCDPLNIETVFPLTLDTLAHYRNKVWVTTMAGMVSWLETGEELG